MNKQSISNDNKCSRCNKGTLIDSDSASEKCSECGWLDEAVQE